MAETETSLPGSASIPSSWSAAHAACCMQRKSLTATPGDVLGGLPDGSELSWSVPQRDDVIALPAVNASGGGGKVADGDTDGNDDDRTKSVADRRLSSAAEAVAEQLRMIKAKAREQTEPSLNTPPPSSKSSSLTSGLFSVVTTLLSPVTLAYNSVGNHSRPGYDGNDYDHADDDYYNPPPEWRQEDDDALQQPDDGDNGAIHSAPAQNRSLPLDAAVINIQLLQRCMEQLQQQVSVMDCDEIGIPFKTMLRFPCEDRNDPSLCWSQWCHNAECPSSPSGPDEEDEQEDLLRHLKSSDLELLLHVFEALGMAKIIRRSRSDAGKDDLVVLCKDASWDDDRNQEQRNELNTLSETAVAMFDLERAAASSEAQVDRWNQAADDCYDKALQCKREGKKQQALFQLKRKALYQNRAHEMESSILNLHSTLSVLRGAISTRAATAALKGTAETLKQLRENKGMTTDAIDDVCVDWKEEIEMVEAAQATFQQSSYSADVIDEDELMEELENLSLHDPVKESDVTSDKAADDIVQSMPALHISGMEESPKMKQKSKALVAA